MYEAIARFYDLIHAELSADIPLVLELAQETRGPVLELGCGTGRLLLPLARAGYQVVGLDSSLAMLDLARAKLAQEPPEVGKRVTIVEADMASFELRRVFGLILYSNSTFMNLGPTAMQASLACAARHLVPGGRLLIDVDNPGALPGEAGDGLLMLERTLIDPVTGEMVLQFASSRVEEADQVLHVTWLFDTLPDGGGQVTRFVAAMDYYFLYPHQLELMLAMAGLQLEMLMGDYGRRTFAEDSPRLLVLAKSGQER